MLFDFPPLLLWSALVFSLALFLFFYWFVQRYYVARGYHYLESQCDWMLCLEDKKLLFYVLCYIVFEISSIFCCVLIVLHYAFLIF